MPKNLPGNLIVQKNKLYSADAWVVLLDVVLTDDTTFRFCRNTEDIVFDGETYTAFPFELDTTKSTSKGEIPTVTLNVCNVTRSLQPYLESMDGMVGTVVTVRVVNMAHLTENYSELEMTFDVLSSQADVEWVSFTLGAPNPLKKRFPLYRYIAEHCNWIFKGAECTYDGVDTVCNRTIADCRTKLNSARFGGYMGLKGGGLRLA